MVQIGGVGERTSNLFTNVWFKGVINASTGIMETSSIFVCSDFIPITPLITYSCSRTVSREYNNLRCYDANKQYVGTGGTNANAGNPLNNGASFGTFMITNESVAYIRFNDKSNDLTTKYMLVEGEYTASTMPDYEPYGYKVPVVVSGKNLFDGDEPFLNSNTDTKTQMDIWFRLYNTSNLSISAANAVSNAQINQRIERVVTPNSDYNRLVVKHNGKTQDIIIISKVLEAGKNYVVSFDIKNNDVQTVGGIEISNIQIEEGSTATDYEPYHEPTTTNIYLNEPIDGRANIPSEYTEVEYIESTGTQYINTNIIPTNTTGVEAKITICTNNNKDNVFMGCREMSSGENRYWIDVDWTGSKAIIFGFNNNTSTNERYSLNGSDVGKTFIISMNYMNDRTGKINGITYDTSISSKTLSSMSKPIYIFAGNRSGNAAYYYSGKLYNFKITDGTNVIKNFVPCYRNSDNVAGLYDLVSNTFYTNQGTGNFIVGPIKENESISLSDTNVNIPTIKGTNVLTVDTTVQPSNVYVKAKKESQYETIMRERYEEAQAQLEALESGGE